MVRINKDLDEGLKKQKLSRQNYVRALKITEEQLDKQIRERAEREVTDYLVFKALEKSESTSIQVSDDEIKKERQDIISRYEKDEDKKKLKDYFAKDDAETQLIETIKRRKLLMQLERNVKVVEEVPKADKIDDNKKLWTPQGEEKKPTGTLWTPGPAKEKSEDKNE
jgi:FKBP-type peptidyl-prolyl cis-trans isomerase (trigger factor)